MITLLLDPSIVVGNIMWERRENRMELTVGQLYFLDQ
jgi:hypothetical protein